MKTQLLTMDQAADQLCVPIATLRLWRHKGYGPKGALIGRRVMYRERDIEKWIEKQFETAQGA